MQIKSRDANAADLLFTKVWFSGCSNLVFCYKMGKIQGPYGRGQIL